VIVSNENNRENLKNCSIPSHQISVVPPGITDFDLISPDDGDVMNLRDSMKLDKDNFIVLYIGSPLSLRGVDTLINGVSIVSKDIPSLKLVLLSRRRKNELLKEERYIKQLCVDKNIYNRTEVISAFLSREEVKNYIGMSDVVVLPFKLVQSDSPISILEAMALGKPIISTKLDGIPELLGKGKGIIINPNNPQELADALSSLYSNPPMRKDIGERAKAYMVKHPTWEETAQEIVNIIEGITK
jgi:glycosyltransferase involved in cell wall biosynthesis